MPLINDQLTEQASTAFIQVRMTYLANIEWTSCWLDDKTQQRELFVIRANEDINFLNQLISEYNENSPNNVMILKKIYRKREEINFTYSDYFLAENAAFRKQVHESLFAQIKQQCDAHHIKSINELGGLSNNLLGDSARSLSDIVANMEEKKLGSFFTLLDKGNKQALEQMADLYQETESEHVVIKNFLNQNSIEFLGGVNSKNFKVNPVDGSKSFVIKIENRMGVPKSVEIRLRNVPSLSDKFVPVIVDRPVSFQNNAQTTEMRSIVITDFCRGGDLESFGRDVHNKNIATHIKSTINIYRQMGTILKEMCNNNCAFLDMKNSNWLLDEHQKVRLVDTKSFVPIEHGILTQKQLDNAWYFCRHTWFISPEELGMFSAQLHDNIDVEKMHAFMLGKNLYQNLTGVSHTYLEDKYDFFEFDFNAPIFQTDIGNQFKVLIEGLIHCKPEQRFSIDVMLQHIDNIAISFDKKNISQNFKAVLEHLKTHVNEQPSVLTESNNGSLSKSYKEKIHNILEPNVERIEVHGNITKPGK